MYRKFILFIVILNILICIFNCDFGPGISGRDHCKNYAPVNLDGPSKSSRADNFKTCIDVFSILRASLDSENNDSNLDFMLLDCAILFAKLKECDNESPFPEPIPFKF